LAIAHELAHAYRFSLRQGAHAVPLPTDAIEYRKVELAREDEVNAALTVWGGFDLSQHEAVLKWWQESEEERANQLRE
jgi:hypothetical protein